MSLCSLALDLVNEIDQSPPDTLPPYRDGDVEKVLQEIMQHQAAVTHYYWAVLNGTAPADDPNTSTKNTLPNSSTAATSTLPSTSATPPNTEPTAPDPNQYSQSQQPGTNTSQPDWAAHKSCAATVLAHIECIRRNKRLLVAYGYHRLSRIRQLKKRLQSVPQTIINNMCPKEVTYYQMYVETMASYNLNIGMDVFKVNPPYNEAMIEVKVLKDAGTYSFENMEVPLSAGQHCLIPADQVDVLRAQNIITPVKRK